MPGIRKGIPRGLKPRRIYGWRPKAEALGYLDAAATANGKRQGQRQKARATAKGKSEIQGSLRCGGKSAAFGRDDVCVGELEKDKGQKQIPTG